MKRHHIILTTVFLTLAVIFVAGWYLLPIELFPDRDTTNNSDITQYAVWEHEDRCFYLDVADTSTLRRQGLSGRESLGSNEGMLFLYRLSGEYGFWMRDMNFPIDIIWLDRNDEIVTIVSSALPDSYPEIYYPDNSARKIIEVSAGVAEKLDLNIGDRLDVSPATSTPSVDCAML
ncbi:MAG: DUF192 domain-containing protein [Candidatus Paceibacterota bacterium]